MTDDITAKVQETVARLREEVIVCAFSDGRIQSGSLADRLIRERGNAADLLEALAAENAAMAADIATLRECAKAEMERAEKAEVDLLGVCQREAEMIHRYDGKLEAAEADRDRLAKELAEARAAIARWNITDDGDLVRVCRGEHEKWEDCSAHEEVFVPRVRAEAAEADRDRLEKELAEARNAALEEAANMAREGFMIVAPEGVGQRQSLDSYRAQISANILAMKGGTS